MGYIVMIKLTGEALYFHGPFENYGQAQDWIANRPKQPGEQASIQLLSTP